MMMVLSALRPDASLPEFLAHRAKSASVRRLSIDIGVGTSVFAAAVYWRPSGWLVVGSLAVILLTYGAWGIGDRARSAAAARDSRLSRAFLNVLCLALGAIGVLATAVLLYSVWALALGTWIS
jgi:hypothetical protein